MANAHTDKGARRAERGRKRDRGRERKGEEERVRERECGRQREGEWVKSIYISVNHNLSACVNEERMKDRTQERKGEPELCSFYHAFHTIRAAFNTIQFEQS